MKNSKTSMNLFSLHGILLIIAAVFLGVSFVSRPGNQTFEEITVKRINIVEEDGTLRMVLSNKERQHPGRMDGKDFPDRERQAGIIFFNDESDEAGGLVYGVQKSGEQKVSFLSFTMDQYKHDQVIQVLNQDFIVEDEVHSMRGFMVNQFPQGSRLMSLMEKMEEAQRIEDLDIRQQRMQEIQQTMGSRPVTFMGKGNDGNGLFIFDNEGMPKLMVYVDNMGNPRIQTMDAEYNLIDLIPSE